VTKYGIPAAPLAEAWPSLSLPLRAARAIATKLGFRGTALPPLTPTGLRASVERSLRRLGTDYVDILFLHEPREDRIPSLQGVVDELYKLQRSGVARAFGLAGGWRGISGLLPMAPPLGMVIQTGESEWPPEVEPDVTYGAIAPGPQTYFSPTIESSEAVRQLRVALGRRSGGVVLVSTTKFEHLHCLAEVAAQAHP
jgi:hypothetical protein